MASSGSNFSDGQGSKDCILDHSTFPCKHSTFKPAQELRPRGGINGNTVPDTLLDHLDLQFVSQQSHRLLCTGLSTNTQLKGGKLFGICKVWKFLPKLNWNQFPWGIKPTVASFFKTTAEKFWLTPALWQSCRPSLSCQYHLDPKLQVYSG